MVYCLPMLIIKLYPCNIKLMLQDFAPHYEIDLDTALQYVRMRGIRECMHVVSCSCSPEGVDNPSVCVQEVTVCSLFYVLAMTISRHHILSRLRKNVILRLLAIPMPTTAYHYYGSTVASGVLEAPNHQAISASGPRSITTATCWMPTSKPHFPRQQAE